MEQAKELSIVLWATDVPALARFLAEVAGLAIEEQHPGLALLTAGQTRLEVHADEAYRGHPWYDALRREGAARGIGAELRVRVGNLDAAYRKALILGAAAIYPPYNADGQLECQLLGPDGFMVSLWQPLEPPG